MKLKQLHYLPTLAECGTIKVAAAKLGISPSTLTKHVDKLEQQFNVPLFTRSGTIFSATRDGHLYIAACNQILATFSACQTAIHANLQGVAPTLNVAVSASFILQLVPALRTEFISKFPHYHLTFATMRDRDAIAAVLDGQIRIVACHTFTHFEPRLYSLPMASEQSVVAINAITADKLGLTNSDNLSLVTSLPMIRPSSQDALADVASKLYQASHQPCQAFGEVDDAATRLTLAAQNKAWTLVYRRDARATPALRFLPLPSQYDTECSLFYLANNPLSLPGVWCVAKIQEQFMESVNEY